MSAAADAPALNRLSGLVAIGTPPDMPRLRAQCADLKAAGFTDAYPGDLFLEIVPAGQPGDPDRLVFVETDAVLQFREPTILESARATVLAAGLTMESAHYHQVLPPPGRYPDPALMAYHRRALALAGQLGLKRVTTHPGWMFGSAMPEFTGEAARAFHARTLSLTQLNQVAFEAYGGETAVWRDSVDLYQRLCEWAATAGLAITLETAISEWYGLTLHPDRLLEFHAAVRAPNLGFCLDAGHCHLNGLDVAAVARACAPALLETHFHDNHGTRDEHLPLGAGTIDWPRVAQTLRATRYDGLITFEHPDPRRSAPPWRAACARGRPQPLKEAGA